MYKFGSLGAFEEKYLMKKEDVKTRKSYQETEICWRGCMQLSTSFARLCYTATGNSPGHDIKKDISICFQ